MKLDVVVIGAGPYGLSVAAHLAPTTRSMRVFGTPMAFWTNDVPEGMLLKSEGFASNLSDPGGRYPLGAFCAERGIPYSDVGTPVTVETFSAYGRAFQERFVPRLERRQVTRLERAGTGFSIELDDGERLEAARVVLATGIGAFARVPAELEGLPPTRVSHSRDRAGYGEFAGKRLVVVGAGASAMDVAATAHRAGAKVTVVARRSAIRFFPPKGPRGLLSALRAPMTPLGPGWKKLACCRLPALFHALPEAWRLAVVSRYLGPAPAWSVRDTLVGNVPFLLDAAVAGATHDASGVRLTLAALDGGPERVIEADHVVAATGYAIDLDKLGFLSERLRGAIRRVGGAPALSPSFETSVAGLYCVGTVSANDFGPMFRFVCGADYTARRVVRDFRRAAWGAWFGRVVGRCVEAASSPRSRARPPVARQEMGS